MVGKEPGKGSPGPELLSEMMVIEGTGVAELLRQLLVEEGVEAVEQAGAGVHAQPTLTFTSWPSYL
jgi:hypothetical protein